MTERLIIAGAGGQGIMLAGKVLAQAAMMEGKFVTWLPAYGAEVRGGTSHCMLVISDEEIGSPYVNIADTLIVMNAPSLEKFEKRLSPGGILIVNSSLANASARGKIKIEEHPFSDIAAKMGNIKIANMIALGSYLVQSKTLKLKSVFAAMEAFAPKDRSELLQINRKALMKGASF